MPMIRTTEKQLDLYKTLWSKWSTSNKPSWGTFLGFCLKTPQIPDDHKVTEYKKTVAVQ